jgi:aminopeptidase N
MMRAARLLILLVLAVPAGAQTRASGQTNASGGVLLPEQACYDVGHYDLILRVDPAQRSIEGRLAMRADLVAQSRELLMHLDPALAVQRVLIRVQGGAEARPVDAIREGGRLRVPLEGVEPGEALEVLVDYAGQPQEARNPPWDGGFTWAATETGQPWIATSCQGEGADLWWPCKDHPSDEPATFDLHISVPKPLVVATNGRLMSVEDGGFSREDGRPTSEDGWWTHHWHVSTPINNYGVALAIAPYVTVGTTVESVAGDSFEYTFWVLPEHREQAEAVLPEFVRELKGLEELCGPYPWRADKAGVAETPFLGMEHQSIIAYGAEFRGDRDLGYDYDWLYHHELSHEWWGNLVSARDWKDFWIHEGIGTYMQALYLERRFGPEAYHRKMRFDLKRVMNRGSVAPRDARTTQEMYFASNHPDAPDGDVYMKGSWICHTLRWLLGDEAFFDVLRRWAYPDPALEATTDGSACRFSDTDELLAIAEEVSGVELGWFFELYLRQPHLPRLEVTREGDALELAWETPDDLPFPMPVEVQVGEQRVRVPMADGRGRIEVGEATWAVDPDWWLLMVRELERERFQR